MPHCLLVMTQLEHWFQYFPSLRSDNGAHWEKPQFPPVWAFHPNRSAPLWLFYTLSSTHTKKPYRMFLWCMEEGDLHQEFSVTACIHHTEYCAAPNHCVLWKKTKHRDRSDMLLTCQKLLIGGDKLQLKTAMAYSHQFWSLLKYSTAN